MLLTDAAILAHPQLPAVLRQLAATFVAAQAEQPRMATVFATQQRWLLGHLAMALYFRAEAAGNDKGLHSAQFLDHTAATAIASRNTAHAFLQEMLHYGLIRQVPAADRRFRCLEPSPASVAALDNWVMIHLHVLDCLDGGCRVERYHAAPAAVSRVQPLIADALLKTQAVRNPQATFSLFTWLNQGGLVMDSLIAGLEEVPQDPQRIKSTMTSTQAIASRLGLSRTHLARKLREAEAIGSIGWIGARGRSTLWVSPDFRQEYYRYQAIKLALIDASLATANL